MILVFGQALVYWTGVLAGIFFLFAFIGCSCISGFAPLAKFRVAGLMKRHHRFFICMAFAFFLVHMSLAVLSRSFNVWI